MIEWVQPEALCEFLLELNEEIIIFYLSCYNLPLVKVKERENEYHSYRIKKYVLGYSYLKIWSRIANFYFHQVKHSGFHLSKVFLMLFLSLNKKLTDYSTCTELINKNYKVIKRNFFSYSEWNFVKSTVVIVFSLRHGLHNDLIRNSGPNNSEPSSAVFNPFMKTELKSWVSKFEAIEKCI